MTSIKRVAGGRVLPVLLAGAHLLWAGCLVVAAVVLVVIETGGSFRDDGDWTDWLARVMIFVALAGASAYAATVILRGRLSTSRTRAGVVALISVGQPILVAASTWMTWPK